jgi:hypothetical protein
MTHPPSAVTVRPHARRRDAYRQANAPPRPGLSPTGPFLAFGPPHPAPAAGPAPRPCYTGLARAASPDHNPT